MPDGLITTEDLLIEEKGAGHQIILQGIKKHSPEMSILPAEVITGNTDEVEIITELPTVQYRNPNEGTPRTKAKRKTEIFQAKILDSQVAVDCELADAKKPKARARLFENEMALRVRAAMNTSCYQLYYGDPGKGDKGFPGIIKQMLHDEAHVYDVGGKNGVTSIFILEPDPAMMSFIWANDRVMRTIAGPWKEETVYDEKGDPFQAYVNWLRGSNGFKLAGVDACIRIKGFSKDEAGKMVTDKLVGEGLYLADELGMTNPIILMNPRSLKQLKDSREATREDGKAAPTPKDVDGAPIYKTSHLINGEKM